MDRYNTRHTHVISKKNSMFPSNNKGNNLRKGLWIFVQWNIWSHRNKVVFRKGKVNAENIFFMRQIESVDMDETQNFYCEVFIHITVSMPN